MLATIVKDALGNDNLSDDVQDNLLKRSDILKELMGMTISHENNDRAGKMWAHHKLLTYLDSAR